MSTHIGPDNPTKRPPTIDEAWNYVFGDLICSECKALIYSSAVERPGWTNPSIQQLSASHVCHYNFNYSFDSPLTLQEQLQAHRAKHRETERTTEDNRGVPTRAKQ